MPFFDFATDNVKEQKGIRRDYGDFWILMARAGVANKKYEKSLERISAPHRRAIEIGKLPTHIYTELLIQVYADAVIKDWGGEGAVDQEGNVLACTKENVIKVFTAAPDLFSVVVQDAQNYELFKDEAIKADSGN